MGSFLKKASFGLALPFVLLSLMAAQSPTTTSLALSPANYVASGTIVTLTATVTNPGSVTTGTVNFCNAASTDCSPGSGLYGTAQLTGAGTATILKVFSYGVNNIYATFLPTTANAGSASLTNFVTVGGSASYTSTTTLTAGGSTGNYTLSGTVTAFGGQPLGGDAVNFLDTTSGNAQIATTSLAPAVTTFTAPILYAAGPWPYQMAVGDFNGDGKSDIAIAEQNGQNAVDVMIGHGDGTFSAPVSYSAGRGTFYVAVGDFNGDGIQDLAVPNRTDGTISIFLGRGDGTFQPQVAYAAGVTPTRLAVGDFNHDGYLDIVVNNDSSTTFATLLGNGNGSFRAPITHASGATASKPSGDASTLAVGDFNHDGNLDVVALNSSDNTVSVMMGNGNGTFQPLVRYSVGTYPEEVVVADFNGDGYLDIAVANSSDSKVSILLGNGDGTFRPQVTYPAGAGPYSLAGGDFNHDGKVDLVTGSVMLLGNGDGTFKAPTAASVGFVVTVGDFNGDGQLDIASVGAVALAEQVASYSQSGISVPGSGTHYVLASYPGDTSRLPSQSATVPLTASGLLAQAISFSPLSSPVTYGSGPFVLSATGGGSGNPVTFSVLSGPGHTVGNLLYADGPGAIVVAADQAGNADYSAAPEVAQSVVVNVATRTVGVSCSPNPTTYGASSTTCTATASAGAGSMVFTYNGGTSWITVPISGGTASAVGFGGAAAGTYSVVATASGDSNYANGASGTTNYVINPATPTVSVSCLANPITYGAETSNCTASVTGGATGTIAWTINGGGWTTTPVASPSAGGFNGYAAGSYTIGVTYSGDGNYTSGSSSTVLTILKATRTVALSCAPNPTNYGSSHTTCTATVSAGGGSVNFTYNGGTPWGTVGIGGGTASIAGFDGAAAATYPVLATASGDPNYVDGASGSTNYIVNKSATSMTGVIAPNPITFGQSFTVSGHVDCNSACGSLQYFIDGSPWGVNSLNGAGNYAAGYGTATTGVHMIQVNYLGDANHSPSSWGPAPVTVLPIATSVTVSCSPNPLTYGTSASCTAHVSGGGGTVTFTGTSSEPGPWVEPVDGSGNAVLSGFSDWPIGTYTISVISSGDANYSGASNSTAFTVIPAGPSVLMWAAGNQFESTASLSLAPVTAGNANGVTAQLFGGNSPTGTVAFANGGTSYGTLPIQSVSTTNLFSQSVDMTNGSVWGPAGETLTPNAGLAPDGTSSATQIVSTGTDPQTYQTVTTGGVSNQTFTASLWVKASGSAIGKQGRIWMFPSDGSIPGCSVPETGTWTRVSCTISFGPSLGPSLTVRYDMTDAGAASGDTVLVWGPQLEASSMPGPYVPTTSAAATASQPISNAGSYVTSPGAYTVTAAYGGDGTNTAASSSIGLTAIAASPLSVMTVNPTTTPYGSPVSMSALISTGGDAPTGVLNFASDGGNVASASPTAATTTNYIPFSRNFSMWSWEATNPTSVEPGTTPGPNGLPGDVATVVFPSTTGTYSGIRYTDSTTNLVGKTMTFSFWVRGDAPSALTFYLADWPYSGTFAAGNGCGVTTTWQRCSVSGTFPAAANGGFYVPIRSDNQASPITIYVWGPQLEEGAAGPYVSTAGSARTALGGTATGSISTLPVGTHAMTAAIAADSNINAATSAPVTEIITAITPLGMSVSCSPNPITYGPQTSTCTATGLPSDATGTVAFSFNGTNWANPTVSGGSASASGFNGMPAGSYSITAGYSGDGNYTPASAPTTLTIIAAPSTVSVSCSPNPLTYGGGNTTCTATVTSGATGSVTFLANGGFWTTVPLSGNTASAAGWGGGSWPAGSYPVAVTYNGDSNYTVASSSTTLTINKATPTLDWTTPANIVYGTALSAIQLDATSGGVAGTFAYTPAAGTVLPVGSHTLSATFTPNDPANYNTMSIIVTQVVVPATPTVGVSCSPNPITFGPQTTLCTASVSGSPTGSLTWTINGGAWTVTPVASPTAGGFNGYPVGSYTIAVAYSGDSNNNVGTPGSTVLAIVPALTTTTITSSLNPSVLGQNVSWPCSVTSPDGTPTGMITYTLDGNPLGTISATDAPWRDRKSVV